MLPLHLFRKPAFTGVQLAALAVSASMFALFLYLTFYLQGFLGHEPLEAGLRYLPLTVTNFFVAAAAGAAAVRGPGALHPQRRPGPHGAGPAADGRPRRQPGVDRAARRLRPRRRGRGPDQPGDRRRGGVRRAEGAERHGLRDQRHVPAGRHRDRHRRLGSDLPRPRRRARSRSWRRARPRPPATSPASWWRRCPPATSTPPWPRSPRAAARARADAAREGFLAGMNEILMLGGILAFAGARRRPVAGPRERHRARRGRRARGASRARRFRSPWRRSAATSARQEEPARRGRLLRVCASRNPETGAIDSSVNGGDTMAAACGRPPFSPLRTKKENLSREDLRPRQRGARRRRREAHGPGFQAPRPLRREEPEPVRHPRHRGRHADPRGRCRGRRRDRRRDHGPRVRLPRAAQGGIARRRPLGAPHRRGARRLGRVRHRLRARQGARVRVARPGAAGPAVGRRRVLHDRRRGGRPPEDAVAHPGDQDRRPGRQAPLRAPGRVRLRHRGRASCPP